MIQLDALRTIAVLTACGTFCIVMMKILRAVLQVRDDIKRHFWEHDQLWIDYCILHKIPIRVSPKGRRINGEAEHNTVGDEVDSQGAHA